jgi:hypothetical protein
MENCKTDKNQNFGSIVYIILFFLFTLLSSNNLQNNYRSSTRWFSHSESCFKDFSGNSAGILSNVVSLRDLYKILAVSLADPDLYPFSVQNQLSTFNSRIAQDFILAEKTRLSIIPILNQRLFIHLPTSEDDPLPDLS